MLARIGHRDDHVAIGDRDLHPPQPRLRIAGMNAGADVELEAVPRADHVHLRLRERHALAGAVVGDDLLDLGDHLALAGWAAHVRTMIEIGVKLAADLEHRDLEALEADELAAGIRELRRRTDVYLTHMFPAFSSTLFSIE